LALTRGMEGDPSVTVSTEEGAEKSREEGKSIRAGESVVIEEYTSSPQDSELISDKLASERSLESGSVYHPTTTFLDKSLGEADYSDSTSRGSAMVTQQIPHGLATTSLAGFSSEKVKYSEIAGAEPVRRVIVQEGDSLAKIIIAVYGKFNQDLLHAVLQLNPHISDPNLLFVGQTIELPMIIAKVY
jgi:nucleoid-associated protein YgaU